VSKNRVAETLSELADQADTIASMAPRFDSSHIYYPWENIDTNFEAFNEGLQRLRAQLGEGLFETLVAMAAQMRACFDADPENRTGETRKGKQIGTDIADLVDDRIEALKGRPEG
jgi:hypothetical protein